MTQVVITVELTPATAEIIKMLADIESQEDIKPSVPDKKDKKIKHIAAKTEQSQAPDEKAPSMTDVRAVALKLSKAGKQTELKEIFAKYGADKLSGVAESDYPALMKDLEAANV